MNDFTIKTYKILLSRLSNHGYAFQTFSEYLRSPANKVILLRHDVDALKENSLRFAEIQDEMSIHGSYYFRVVPQSFDKEVIRKIAGLGHEIGYHYETMDTVRGNVVRAYDEFCYNLVLFRKIVPIETICMHGSPLSKYDNRAIWENYDYKKLGIIGEPYFDLDFSRVLYLTDTGRRWDGGKVSVRDKVGSSQFAVRSSQFTPQPGNCELGTANYFFHSTCDIISAANLGQLPDQIMFTFHPQRWTDKPGPWIRELVLQNLKNVVKRWIVRREQ
jgi:hypothetical protein